MSTTKKAGAGPVSDIVSVLRDARQWVEKSTSQVRGLSAEAAAPGEEMLRRIDAALASPPPAVVPDEVRRLSEAATPGTLYTVDQPWGDGTWIVAGNPDPHAGFAVADCEGMFDRENERVDAPEAIRDVSAADDAAFIVAAVNYVRTLLSTPSRRTDAPPAGGGALPEGWRLVPVEPSEEMCLAGLGVDRTSVFSAPSVMRDMASCYRAMLAAAPAVPEPAAGGSREADDPLVTLKQMVERKLDRYRRERMSTQTLPARLERWRDRPFEPHESGQGYRYGDDGSVHIRLTNADARSTLSAPSEAQDAGEGLSLTALHAANIARQAEWCPDQVPDLSFRGNELAGEAGETSEALILHAAEISRATGRASNIVKKLERERYGWRGSRATKADLADELADMVICADLCAVTAGIDLSAAVVAKFNATSEKQGLATRLPTNRADTGAEGGQ